MLSLCDAKTYVLEQRGSGSSHYAVACMQESVELAAKMWQRCLHVLSANRKMARSIHVSWDSAYLDGGVGRPMPPTFPARDKDRIIARHHLGDPQPVHR